MSSHPVTLFRQSFRNSLLVILAFMTVFSSFGLVHGLIASLNTEVYHAFDLIRWSQGFVASSLMAALLALTLPWLLLSWFGEWLYTRALKRSELFALIWREFLSWWAPMSLSLLGLSALSHFVVYDSGRELAWELAFFIPALSLFMALIFAANTDLLRKLLLPGSGLLLWLLLGDGWELSGFKAGHTLTLIAGVGILAWLYRQIALAQSDLSLEVPGRVDDENQAMQRSWLFQSLALLPFKWVSKPARLTTGWQASLKLLSGHPYMLNLQLLLGLGLALFLGAVFLGRAHLEHLPGSETLWSLSFVVLFACLLLLPVRLAGARYWEFLRTRPLAAHWQYLINWGVQGLFLLGLTGISAILIWSLPEIAQVLNFASIASSLLFLWLGGELVVGLLLLLLAFSLTSSPNMIITLLVLLQSSDWPALALWLSVLAFRGWDLWHFQGHFWEPQSTLKNVLKQGVKHYLPPTSAMLGILFLGIQTQPLAGFVSLPEQDTRFSISTQERWVLGRAVIEAIYVKEHQYLDLLYEEDRYGYNFASYYPIEGIQALLKKPHDPELALKMATQLVIPPSFGNFEDRVYFLKGKSDYNSEIIAYYQEQAQYWLKFGSAGSQAGKHYLQALMAEVRGDYNLASAENQKALADKQNVEWLLQKARIQWLLLRYAPALEQLKAIAEGYPEQAEKAWRAAEKIAAEAGQPALALEYLLRSLEARQKQTGEPGSMIFRAEAAESYRRRSFTELELHRLSDSRSGLCTQLPTLIADFKQREVAPKTIALLNNSAKACREGPVVSGNQTYSRASREDAIWLLQHGQKVLAVQAMGTPDMQGLKAQILLELGQKAKAQSLAQAVALPWQSKERENIYLYSLIEYLHSKSDYQQQWQAHRVLLQTLANPTRDSGLQVLLNSPDPSQDWALIVKAYTAQAKVLAELKQLYGAYNTLCHAYEQTGMVEASKHRSLRKLEVMLYLEQTLPSELHSQEVKQAAQLLRQIVYKAE
jgi:hypothetical protein